MKSIITKEQTLDIEQLKQLQEKPAPFTPGERLFWDDPHISAQMLATHLDPSVDLASRKPETIERTVAWIIETLNLKPGDRVLDMGCGPGLYTSRFAQKGLSVTGVDYSRRSVDYATQYAQEHKLDIQYRYENYLDLADTNLYDAVCLIFGDYCPLGPEQRRRLLGNVRRALKPGGHFVFDVSTRAHRKLHGSANKWYAAKSGFWKAGYHLVLEQGFDYPEQSIWLDQIITVEADGKVSVYRNWFQDYTRESITKELEAEGFTVKGTWSDLQGNEYKEDTEWIGVVTRTS